MQKNKICTFAALLSLTLTACGKETSHTEWVADLSKNHIVHTLGGERPALLVLPADHDPETPIPLVLSLHGFTSDSARHDRYFGLSKRVNVDRFALIMANGTRETPMAIASGTPRTFAATSTTPKSMTCSTFPGCLKKPPPISP